MSERTRLRPAGRLARAAQIFALASVYAGLGRLGLLMGTVNGFATLVWLPTGISLAALSIAGFGLWPAVALGALATNMWAGAPPLVACGIAAGNTLEAVLGACALRRMPGFRGALDRLAEVAVIVVCGALLSTAVSATIGVTSLALGGVLSRAQVAMTWIVWWTGDMVSVLVVAPAILTWAARPQGRLRPALAAEATVAVGLLCGGAALVSGLPHPFVAGIPLLRPYLLLLPLAWMVLRHGPPGGAACVLALAVTTVAGTYAGRGFFASADRVVGLLDLHAFLASAALASLTLGAGLAERETNRRECAEKAAILRTVIDGATDAIYLKDLHGRCLLANAAFARQLGVSPEALVGMNEEELIAEDELVPIHRSDQEIARTGQPQSVETTVTIAGAARTFHSTKAPYRDAEGNVFGIIGIARDITERKHDEEVRENEARLRLAAEGAHLGMWFWDIEADRLTWTEPCRSLHGIGDDVEISYARFLSLVHPEDRGRIERAIGRAIEEGHDYAEDLRVVWPDGSVHWIRSLGRLFTHGGTSVRMMMGTSMDITAQRRAEEERAELLERERAACAAARDAARAKDEFLAVVSHELRTPLQAMLGWTQMLRARRPDERTLEKGLETLDRSVKAQARLIEDLLDVSRIIAGKLRLERVRLDLAGVVESALESALGAAAAKSVRVETRIEPLSGDVIGDPQRLQQVVSNLLSNATKFTPSGGRIRVRLGRELAAAKLRVEDDGAGIPKDFLPYVFDRFRQAQETTTRAHGGLGLGLAIVRHIVEMHGGSVTAESAGEGRGAAFTVTLPLVGAQRRALSAERPEALWCDRPAAGSLGGVRVLVVDDDADTCELLELVLHETGAEVRAVRSTRDALAALEAWRPDLLLSDIGMPEEDGYALIRKVRALESAEGGHVPAVALTAFASQSDREQALALGFDAHVAKPASPRELSSMVATLTGR